MVAYRFAKGFGGLFILVCAGLWGAGLNFFAYLTLALIVCWIAIVLAMRGHYFARIRTRLVAQPIRPGMNRERQARKVGAAVRIAEVAQELVSGHEAKRFLNHLNVRETDHPSDHLDDPHADPTLSLTPTKLTELILNPTAPIAERRQAITRLCGLDGQDTIDLLTHALAVQEAELRYRLIRGIERKRQRNPQLKINRRAIERCLLRELEHYRRGSMIVSLYMAETCRTTSDESLILLQAVVDETLDRVFHLLALIYRTPDLYLILSQLREGDETLRSDAVELLDNLLDGALRGRVVKVVEEGVLERAGTEERSDSHTRREGLHALIQKNLKETDCWSLLAGLFIASRLGFQELVEEWMKGQTPTDPLLRCAASIAMTRVTHD